MGGAVENGKDGLVNWAVYFCEYTPYMNPVAEGETHDLPGNNIAYKRPHLLRHAGCSGARAVGVVDQRPPPRRRRPARLDAAPWSSTTSSRSDSVISWFSGSTSPGRTPG